jgi:NitT/TauT family transport system substrate-binding protein
MKLNTTLISLFLIAILLSACGGTATPTTTPEPLVTSTETISEPTATLEPVVYEPVTLKINRSAMASYAPIFIAEAEGYFNEFGITMEYIDILSTQSLPLIVTGDLDVFAGILVTGVLNITSQDPNVKVVADRGHIAPTDQCSYMGILVRKDLYDSGEITSPADLAGQTIISNTAGSAAYILSAYLAQAGLTFDDVTLADIPTTGYIDAFSNKSVAALVTPELYLSRVVDAGNAVLLVGAEDIIGPLQSSLIIFGKNLLVDHPDVGARFLAAYLKGVQQYNEGKTERNVQIVADATGDSVEMLQAACWATINEDGMIDFSAVDAFQQWSVAQGQLEAPVTEEQFWDPSFITAAQALLNP